MNPYTAAGLAQGGAASAKITNEGLVQRKNLQIAEQNQQIQNNLYKARQSQVELQMQQQIQQMQDLMAKEKTTNAFNMYETTGDIKALNSVTENPMLAEQWKATGVARLASTKDYSEEKLRSMGYDPETMDNKNFIVQVKDNGDVQLIDMRRVYAMYGYKPLGERVQEQENAATIAKATATQAEIREDLLKKLADDPSKSIPEKLAAIDGKLAASTKTEETDSYIADYVNGNREQLIKNLPSMGYDTPIDLGNGKTATAYEVAKYMQGDKKPSTTSIDQLSGIREAATAFDNLREKLSKLDWGALQKIKEDVVSVTSADLFNLSESERQSLLDKFSFNSELKVAMASYIKAMTGAAVNEDERHFYAKAMIATDWSSKEAALASMGGFRKGLQTTIDSRTDSLKTLYPATYMDLKALDSSENSEEKPLEKIVDSDFTKNLHGHVYKVGDLFEQDGVNYVVTSIDQYGNAISADEVDENGNRK